MAGARDALRPGKGLSLQHEAQDPASFPMLTGSHETPTNAPALLLLFPVKIIYW